jgi:transporter family-2 protein
MPHMLDKALTLLIGLLGGIAVGIQSPIAGAMSQRIGGAVFSLLLLLTRGGENVGEVRNLPWYMLGAGIFGVILYLTLSHTLPQLGAGVALTLIIVGQLLMGMLSDHFGWFGVSVRPIDITRLLAAGLLLLGGYLMVR